ncbi:putative oxidoreductase Fe-S binding subunit [Anaerotruncus sp. 2789STDY5834896]|uniref:Putative oxidoreductase Fe-S binding subunit n=1 Tax=uncultured Anaerotruncus sp. TaxID=905011 RepID=A0A1C6H472_9FIRM|nr:putative oxidoreductase Fe-S binding subunit [uncultured Anaerotruncus sp.]
MIRKIIHIDQKACNGCGLCARACHEGAIGMVDGKAKLLRDDYCDGLGDCLPTCPTGAITFVEREALPYDRAAVEAKMAARQSGCPGSRAAALHPRQKEEPGAETPSQLAQWPVQIKLVPVSAPYFDGADLLIAADCTAFARGDFHQRFMSGRVTVIGCPKLDGVDYADKLAQILAQNDLRSVTVLRMEVPCCGGLQAAVERALAQCGKNIPCRVVTLRTNGDILSEVER